MCVSNIASHATVVMADRPQHVPTFVDDIYSRLHPIQADIASVNQVHAASRSRAAGHEHA